MCDSNAQKTLTLPQIQHIDKIIGVLVAMQHQIPTAPVRRTTDACDPDAQKDDPWSSHRPTTLKGHRGCDTDSNLATKKVATKRFKQAVAEPILAGLEKLQARPDEVNTKLDGTKKNVSDRRDMMMKRDVSTSVAEAEKLIEESAQASGKLGVNGSERSPEQHAKRTCDIATVMQHDGRFELNVV